MYAFEDTIAAPARPAPTLSAALEDAFCRCADFQSRRLHVGAQGGVELVLCWLDGLISPAETAEELLRPLGDPARFPAADVQGCLDAPRPAAPLPLPPRPTPRLSRCFRRRSSPP